MTEKDLNEKIINLIKSSIPKEANVSNVLKDVLFIGMEAIYRRIRGEVPFTFAEVVKICQEFNISLDSLVGANNTNKAVFSLNLLMPSDSLDVYVKILSAYIDNLKRLKSFSNCFTTTALNLIPYGFFFNTEYIPKFYIFKWIYLMNKEKEYLPFSQLKISSEIVTLQKKLVAELQMIPRSVIILSPLIFKSFINDLKYFAQIRLITNDEIMGFKKELLLVIEELEYITGHGKYRNGNEVMVYLSNVNFETTYTYYGADNFEFTHLRVYNNNGIDSGNSVVCKMQKEWIESLMKASTLISQCGELERHRFFRKQKEIIDKMGT